MEQDKLYTPVRIQRSRRFSNGSPNLLQNKYVGRPTKWGNPFPLSHFTREVALLKYRQYLGEHPELIESAKSELKGKNLVCWCNINQECHADILLHIANS